jgi:pilus assembly protein CpaB
MIAGAAATVGALERVPRLETCPRRDLLVSYAEGKTTAQDLLAVSAHLRRCNRCQTTVSDVERLRLRQESSFGSGDVPQWRRRSLRGLLWGLAGALGFAAVLLLVYTTVRFSAAPARHEERVAVVTPVGEMPPRTIIDACMVTTENLPASEVPAGSYRNLGDVVGKVAMVALPHGAPIRPGDIDTKGVSLGLSYAIPPSMRAVTIAVNQVTSVAGFIRAGDHLDVIATFPTGQSAVARTVIQNVQLVALGSQLENERVAKDGRKPAVAGDTATLLVTPAQAEQLALAEDRGKLRLALRGVGDVATRPIPDATEDSTVASPPATVRVALAIPQYRERQMRFFSPFSSVPTPPAVAVDKPVDTPSVVEVIRGTDVEKVKVLNP